MKTIHVELLTYVVLNTFTAIYGTFGSYIPFFVEPYHWRICPNGEYGKSRCRPEFKFGCKRGYTCIRQRKLTKINSIFSGVCCKIPTSCPVGHIQGPSCSFLKSCPLGYTCNHGVCCLATKYICPIGSKPVSKCRKYYGCKYGALCIHGTCCSFPKKLSFCPKKYFLLPGLHCKHDFQCPGASLCFGDRCCQSMYYFIAPPKKKPSILLNHTPPLFTRPSLKKPPKIKPRLPKIPPKVVTKQPVQETVLKLPKIPKKPIVRRPVVPPHIKVVTCPLGYNKVSDLKCTHLSACPGYSECISGVCCSKTDQQICPADHRVIPEINCNLRQRCPQGTKCLSGVCCLPLRKAPSCPGGLILVTDKSCDKGACAENGICILGSCCRVATPPPVVTNPPLLLELPKIPPVQSPRRPMLSTKPPIRLTMPPLPSKVITIPTPVTPSVRSPPRIPDLLVSNPSNPTFPSFGTPVPTFPPSDIPLFPSIPTDTSVTVKTNLVVQNIPSPTFNTTTLSPIVLVPTSKLFPIVPSDIPLFPSIPTDTSVTVKTNSVVQNIPSPRFKTTTTTLSPIVMVPTSNLLFPVVPRTGTTVAPLVPPGISQVPSILFPIVQSDIPLFPPIPTDTSVTVKTNSVVQNIPNPRFKTTTLSPIVMVPTSNLFPVVPRTGTKVTPLVPPGISQFPSIIDVVQTKAPSRLPVNTIPPSLPSIPTGSPISSLPTDPNLPSFVVPFNPTNPKQPSRNDPPLLPTFDPLFPTTQRTRIEPIPRRGITVSNTIDLPFPTFPSIFPTLPSVPSVSQTSPKLFPAIVNPILNDTVNPVSSFTTSTPSPLVPFPIFPPLLSDSLRPIKPEPSIPPTSLKTLPPMLPFDPTVNLTMSPLMPPLPSIVPTFPQSGQTTKGPLTKFPNIPSIPSKGPIPTPTNPPLNIKEVVNPFPIITPPLNPAIVQIPEPVATPSSPIAIINPSMGPRIFSTSTIARVNDIVNPLPAITPPFNPANILIPQPVATLTPSNPVINPLPSITPPVNPANILTPQSIATPTPPNPVINPLPAIIPPVNPPSILIPKPIATPKPATLVTKPLPAITPQFNPNNILIPKPMATPTPPTPVINPKPSITTPFNPLNILRPQPIATPTPPISIVSDSVIQSPIIPTTLPPIIVPKVTVTDRPIGQIIPFFPPTETIPPLSPISPILQTVTGNPPIGLTTANTRNSTIPPVVIDRFPRITLSPIVTPLNKIPRPPPMLPTPPLPLPPIVIPKPPPIDFQIPPTDVVTPPPVNPPKIPSPPATIPSDNIPPLIPPLIPRPPPLPTVRAPRITTIPVNIPVQIQDVGSTIPSFNFTLPPVNPLAPIIPPYNAPPIIPSVSLAPVIPPAVPSPAGPTFPPFIVTMNMSTFNTSPSLSVNITSPIVPFDGTMPTTGLFGTIPPTVPPNFTSVPSTNSTNPPFIVNIPQFKSSPQPLNDTFMIQNSSDTTPFYNDMLFTTTVPPSNQTGSVSNITYPPFYDVSLPFNSSTLDNVTYFDSTLTSDIPEQTSTKSSIINSNISIPSQPQPTQITNNEATTSVDFNTTLPPTLWVTLRPVNATKPPPGPTSIPGVISKRRTTTSKYIFDFTFPPTIETTKISKVPINSVENTTLSISLSTISLPPVPTSCPKGNITIPGLACDDIFKCPAGSNCYYGFCCLPYETVQVPACLVDFVVTDVCPNPPESDQCRYDRDCGPFMTCCLNSCDRRVCRPTVNPKPSKPR